MRNVAKQPFLHLMKNSILFSFRFTLHMWNTLLLLSNTFFVIFIRPFLMQVFTTKMLDVFSRRNPFINDCTAFWERQRAMERLMSLLGNGACHLITLSLTITSIEVDYTVYLLPMTSFVELYKWYVFEKCPKY